MKILVADDDPVSRRILQAVLTKWDHEVVVVSNGQDAWDKIRDENIRLAIRDWEMPGFSGPEVCEKVRTTPGEGYTFIILLTSRKGKDDLVSGLEAGADDFLTKPCDPNELKVRLKVGMRTLDLETKLIQRNEELEHALAEINHLGELLPICAYCKKIRDDSNYWQQVETYISKKSNTKFSHGICPDCYSRLLKGELE